MKEVSAKVPKLGKEATIMYDFGENLEDAIAKFGAETVFNGFVADATVTLQSAIRRYLEKGVDPQILSDQWRPGTRIPSIAADPKVAALNAFRNMSAEERAALIAEIQALQD